MSLQNYKEERALIAMSTLETQKEAIAEKDKGRGMNHNTTTYRAYLVGVIDTESDPPKFLGCSLFSESNPTLGARFSFVIAEAKGASYEDAFNSIHAMIDECREYDWCKKVLVESRSIDAKKPETRDETHERIEEARDHLAQVYELLGSLTIGEARLHHPDLPSVVIDLLPRVDDARSLLEKLAALANADDALDQQALEHGDGND